MIAEITAIDPQESFAQEKVHFDSLKLGVHVTSDLACLIDTHLCASALCEV